MASGSFRRGVREAVPYASAGFAVAMSFGVLAGSVGLSALEATAMSALVFAGSAQFAALGILSVGGALGPAIAAGALMNSRFVPMGFAIAPSLAGGRARRAVEGQAVVDASWVLAARGDGTFDRSYLFGSTALQYVGWVGGTAVGGAAASVDAEALGLDAVFPAFFLALLIPLVRQRAGAVVAAVGAGVALVLTPLLPAGLPVLVASAAALLGLTRLGRTP